MHAPGFWDILEPSHSFASINITPATSAESSRRLIQYCLDSSRDFCEKGTMRLIKAIIRPNKLEEVKDALTKLSVAGMTVTEVRGHGRQKGHKAVYRGTEYSVTLLPKIMIELVIQDEMVDDVIKTIIETSRTGEIGDGRVFVLPIEQGYNIRTGERDV